MLIALFGHPGAGKDTVARHLVEKHGFVRIAFADKVRELAYELATDNEKMQIDNLGWETCKRKSEHYRKMLERVGDSARKVLGDDVWINVVQYDIHAALESGKSVVITDLRKTNEKEFIEEFCFEFCFNLSLWHVIRPGCEKRSFDECQPEWAGFNVHNFSTVDKLNQRVDEVLEIRK